MAAIDGRARGERGSARPCGPGDPVASPARAERLRAAARFQAVFQHGKRIELPTIVCLWRASERWSIGVTVSRQVRTAPRRNRVRRRLREAWRRIELGGDGAADVVLIGRPLALTCPFPDLLGEVARAFERVAREGRGRA